MRTISETWALALRHHQTGRLRDAERLYREIVVADPGHHEASHMLGVVACQSGDPRSGVEWIGRALTHRPDWAEAWYNQGNAWRDLGNLPQAVTCYRRALQSRPDYPEAHHNLGRVLKLQGERDEAASCFQSAARLKPAFADAHVQLGHVYREAMKLDAAEASYRRALELKPDDVELYFSLGNLFEVQGRLDEALASYRRAANLNPGLAAAQNNVGNVLRLQGNLEDAEACYRRALQLDSRYVWGLANLGTILKDSGRLDEALDCYRAALRWHPDFAKIHSSLLLALQYRTDATLAGLAEAHAAYDRQHAGPLRPVKVSHENDRDPHRRLRLGFVSPDFGRHPVGFFLIRALENLDPTGCEKVCYCNRFIKDDMCTRFRAAADLWRDAAEWDDTRLAATIREDRIDILFDLSGHTGHNRLLAFARKPAPVQITWIGYEGTTGLGAIDYILADRHTIPSDKDAWYRERVVRMPDGYVCYDPPDAAPAVAPPPALNNGYVRFGSFSNLAKITSQVVEVWSRILSRVPGARIALQYQGLQDPSVCRRYLGLFEGAGVDPSRVELLPPTDYGDYLAAYGEVDIMLDPFPFGGGITTCDALWMGVPVVICPGETFASRHSLSHLASAGLTETVATSTDAYVELALALAGDLPRLAALRAELRDRVRSSPLCDGERFAANLMPVLRDLWQAWCRAPVSP